MLSVKRKRKVGAAQTLAFLALFLLIQPVLAIFFRVDFSYNEGWQHFKQYLLQDTIFNTVFLVVFSLLGAAVIGVGLAVMVALFDFPFKKFFKWFFYLPLTIPPYIAAYVFSGMLSYTGIVQKTLRLWNVPHTPGSFDMMNLRGAIFVYAITLFPYVYGPVRAFLEHHASSLMDVARVHGHSPFKILIKVILPLIRVPLVGGLTLIMMEVISDYGVVRYFNLRTVSSAIFSSWFGTGETVVAIRLSFYMMMTILVFQSMEDLLRGRRRYHLSGNQPRALQPILLKGWKRSVGMLALLGTAIVVFVVPVGQMIFWAVRALDQVHLGQIGQIVFNTLFYSLLASTLILVLNIGIIHSRRWLPVKAGRLMDKMAQLGYAIPGAIIAIGAITVFVGLDNVLYPIYQWVNPETKKLVLSTSTIMLVYAFIVRYMAAGYNSVFSGFSKIGLKYSEAAASLGKGRFKALWRIELPMVKHSLITGFILTLIDILKELPLTLLLRPFNFNTLASRAYEYANDERIMEASVPALLIIMISVAALAVFAVVNHRKEESMAKGGTAS